MSRKQIHNNSANRLEKPQPWVLVNKEKECQLVMNEAEGEESGMERPAIGNEWRMRKQARPVGGWGLTVAKEISKDFTTLSLTVYIQSLLFAVCCWW